MEIGNKDSEGNAYIILGNAYNSLGDFRKATEFLQQGLSVAKETGNRNSEGNAYNILGNAYHSLGDFKKAIEFLQQGLSVAKEIGNKASEANAYNLLGNAYHSLADFRKAVEYLQEGLSIAKEIGNKELEVNTYNLLGNAYHSLGELKKEIKFLQQALSIAKEIGNKNSEGDAYYLLGNAYHCLGDLRKAIEFSQQAVGVAKEIGNKDLEGSAYSKLGHVYFDFGDVEKGIEFHKRALSIAKETGNKNSEDTAYGSLGNVYYSLGEFNKAIEYHQRGLSIAKEIGNKDSEGKTYGNLGNAYNSLGDFKTAIEFHQQDLNTAKETGNKHSEGTAYSNLGNAYFSLGDLEKAIGFLQQALRIAKKIGDKDSKGKAYSNLGTTYQSLGDMEKAIKFYQQALNTAEETGNKHSEGTAYHNLGTAHCSLGDFDQGIEFLQQALSFARKIGSKESEGKIYMNLGYAYESLSDFEKGIEFYQEALIIAKEIEHKYMKEQAYAKLGVAFYRLKDFPKAEKFFELSIKLFEDMRFLLQEKDEWKISFRDERDSYSFLWLVQLLQGKTIEALLTAEQGRAQALTDLMVLQYGIKSTPPTSKEQMERITNIFSHISSPTTFLAEVAETLHLWVILDEQEGQFMRRKINCTLKYLNDKAYKQIGVEIGVKCEDRTLDNPEDEAIEKLSDGDTDDKLSLQSEGDALKELFGAVIAPISHLIKGDELIIIPEGSSFFIPYAALVDQNSRYLSETLRIRLAPSLTSLSLLTECPNGRHSTSGALLVGDPWTETVRFKGKKIQQLPGAEKEVKMIGKILNVEPLTGKKAAKDQVLCKLNSVSLVHIAAHGCAETGEIILSPNLACSEQPKEEDFVLTMEDVLNSKLNAKLVVLSCCHSGRGKIKAEGVVGMARAFLGAGARSVIASLWAIDDEATLEFMRHFYDNLVNGKSASKSLHEAMKWMRESDDFNAMKYWAPFVLIGDDVTFNFSQKR